MKPYVDFIKFNEDVLTLCDAKGLDPNFITEEEWGRCYDLATEDYQSALADAIFYAIF